MQGCADTHVGGPYFKRGTSVCCTVAVFIAHGDVRYLYDPQRHCWYREMLDPDTLRSMVWVGASGTRWRYEPNDASWHERIDDMSTTTTPSSAPEMTTETMISKYIKLRDRKEEIAKRHKAELAPYNDALTALEARLLAALDKDSLQSMRSADGTAYRTTKVSVTVNRWSDALQFIRDNDAWELLEARVNKTAAEEHMKETGMPVPGTAVRREIAVNVRRGA